MKTRTGLATALVLAASAAQAVTPCDRLVAYARGLPPSVWASGDKALAPALVFAGDPSDDDTKPAARTALERRLAALPEVHENLGVDDGDAVEVDRLAGTDLYALTSVQGTAHCYVSVFIRARPGLDPNLQPSIVPGPKSLAGDGTNICWTTVEGLGRAFDTPVHVVHDLVGPTATTAAFVLTPWRGDGWGAPCRAELTFRAAYTLSNTYCGDKAVCDAGAKIARDVAAAYNRMRETNSSASEFAFGPPPPPDFAARLAPVKLAEPGGDFPTFNAAAGGDLSYGGGGHVLFPLQVGDRWYAAAVGHGGVGWREDNSTLLAIFDLNGQTLTPLAAFVVERSLAGLDSAKTTPVTSD